MSKTTKQPVAKKTGTKKEGFENSNTSMLEDFLYEELKDIYFFIYKTIILPYHTISTEKQNSLLTSLHI